MVLFVLPLTDVGMKRWGLRASYLSSDTNADAEQNACINRLNPNVLYTMLGNVVIHSILSFQQNSMV